MICRRHNAVATHTEHGVAYCLRCFGEARIEAVAAASVTDLMRRLEGRK